MGAEHELCKLDDTRALALIQAGLDDDSVTFDTVLSDIADPQTLQAQLGNVSHLYNIGSFAEDIINGKKVKDVISHFDQSKFNFAMERLIAMEKQGVDVEMHQELDDLNNDIIV